MPKKTQQITIDTDKETLRALSDETIKKMAKASKNPAIFLRLMKDLRKAALTEKKPGFTINSDKKTLQALSDETIRKMCEASDNPEIFKAMMMDLRKLAFEVEKKDIKILIDTDIQTLSSLTNKTIDKMAASTAHPKLFKQLMTDFKKSK